MHDAPSFDGPANGPDKRAVPCPLTDGRGVQRVAIVSGIEISDDASGSNKRTMTLALGLSGTDRLYIIDEGNPNQPKKLGYWQAPGSILYKTPSVDDFTKWVAVPVQKSDGVSWFVLGLSVPSKPVVVAELKGQGNTGSMSDGVLYTAINGQLMAVDMNLSSYSVVKINGIDQSNNSRAANEYVIDKTKTKCIGWIELIARELKNYQETKFIGNKTVNLHERRLNITGTPSMNGVTAKAQVKMTEGNELPKDLKYNWAYSVKHTVGKNGKPQMIEFLANDQPSGGSHQTWTQDGNSPDPGLIFTDTVFGQTKNVVVGWNLNLTISSNNAKIKSTNAAIAIRAKNPDPKTVVNQIRLLNETGLTTDDVEAMARLLWHESQYTYKQFAEQYRSNTQIPGFPLMSTNGDGGIGQITPSNFPYDKSFNQAKVTWGNNFSDFAHKYPEYTGWLKNSKISSDDKVNSVKKLVRGVFWDWRENIRYVKKTWIEKKAIVDKAEIKETTKYTTSEMLAKVNDYRKKNNLPQLNGLRMLGRANLKVRIKAGSNWDWEADPSSKINAYQVEVARLYNGNDISCYKEFIVKLMPDGITPVIDDVKNGIGIIGYEHNHDMHDENPFYCKQVFYPEKPNPYL